MGMTSTLAAAEIEALQVVAERAFEAAWGAVPAPVGSGFTRMVPVWQMAGSLHWLLSDGDGRIHVGQSAAGTTGTTAREAACGTAALPPPGADPDFWLMRPYGVFRVPDPERARWRAALAARLGEPEANKLLARAEKKLREGAMRDFRRCLNPVALRLAQAMLSRERRTGSAKDLRLSAYNALVGVDTAGVAAPEIDHRRAGARRREAVGTLLEFGRYLLSERGITEGVDRGESASLLLARHFGVRESVIWRLNTEDARARQTFDHRDLVDLLVAANAMPDERLPATPREWSDLHGCCVWTRSRGMDLLPFLRQARSAAHVYEMLWSHEPARTTRNA